MKMLDRYVNFGMVNTIVVGLRAGFFDIVDGFGDSYLDQDNPLALDVKEAHDSWLEVELDPVNNLAPLHEAAVRIDFFLIGMGATVELFLEYDPSNSVHADFYRSRHSEALPSPRLVTLIDGEELPLGLHTAYWNGRDQTEEQRILLAGQYTLKLVARRGRLIRRARTTIEIAPPQSWSLGMHIIKHGWPENSADAMRTTGVSLAALGDGTAYTGDSTSGLTAEQAHEYWRKSAIAVFDGHADPQSLQFHDAEGVPARRSGKSFLGVASDARSPSVSLHGQPQDIYKDMQLAILLGCRTGDTVTEVHRRIQTVRSALEVPVNGRYDGLTRRGVFAFEFARGLPRDGELDEEVLAQLGVMPSGDELTADEVRQVQRALRQWSRHIGRLREMHGDETKAEREQYYADELRRFQEMAWLRVTGLADQQTKERLRLAGDDQLGADNIAEEFVRRGCGIALGFPDYSHFGPAEQWIAEFVRWLGAGRSITDARTLAMIPIDARHRPDLRFRGYSGDATWEQSRVVPARYGGSL